MWHIVISRRTWKAHWSVVELELQSRGVAFQLHCTDSVQDISSLVDRVIKNGDSKFVSVGGDGALHWLLNGVLEHDWDSPPTMGIIPAGTGCDFARTVGIASDRVMAVQNLVDGEAIEVDIGLAEGEWGQRYFINVADVGIAAVAAHRAEQLRFLGKLRYLAGLWLSLPAARRQQVVINTDGSEIVEQCLAVIIANGRYFGGGFEVAPEAAIDDKRLDLLVARGSFWTLPFLVRDVIGARHLARKDIVVRKVESVRISGQSMVVEADGEYLGRTPVEIKLVTASIKVQLPAPAK
jgi:YegS/Rv2252/BmrU family lipid kinase